RRVGGSHPNTRKTGAHCHPRSPAHPFRKERGTNGARKSGAIRESWRWGPRPQRGGPAGGLKQNNKFIENWQRVQLTRRAACFECREMTLERKSPAFWSGETTD